MPNLLARLLTRSFPAKAETRLGSAGDYAAEEQDRAGLAYESRAFRLWYESRAGGRGSPVVLDLGRTHPDSLRFFEAARARLAVAALDVNLSGTGFDLQLGENPSWGPFDGILCWDLPNYLGDEQLESLGRWMARNSDSGTMVMVCLASHVPYAEFPGQYGIESESKLRFYRDPKAAETRRIVRSSHELVKLWSQFAAVRSFLLRNGMQEFVLRRR